MTTRKLQRLLRNFIRGGMILRSTKRPSRTSCSKAGSGEHLSVRWLSDKLLEALVVKQYPSQSDAASALFPACEIWWPVRLSGERRFQRNGLFNLVA